MWNHELKLTQAQLQTYAKYYSPTALKEKIADPAFWEQANAMLLYYASIAYYGMSSSKTSVLAKATIVGAIGYFISPVDLIPDVLPVIGYVDDLTVLKAAIDASSTLATPEVRREALKKVRVKHPDFTE